MPTFLRKKLSFLPTKRKRQKIRFLAQITASAGRSSFACFSSKEAVFFADRAEEAENPISCANYGECGAKFFAKLSFKKAKNPCACRAPFMLNKKTRRVARFSFIFICIRFIHFSLFERKVEQ
ncbi:MAG: hypothetical protein ACI4QR_01025, partial [Eubacteriales bacterium]